jgi:hypothetical protein
VSRIRFNYHDFRDIRDFGITQGFAAGAEPLYQFSAMVYQVYLSMYF